MICETRELYVCAEVRCLKVDTKQSLSASEIYDVGFDIEVERAGVSIYNSIGQKMMEKDIDYNKQKTYDISSYDAGLYTVIIRNNDGVVMRSSKVIVISN
jgi:hypothetical protein